MWLNHYISGPYTCSLAGEAVVKLEFGVVSEEDCAQMSWDTESCKFYTYYSVDSSPLQLACAILSECNDRTSDPNVVSGPSDCNGIAIVSESYPMCFKVGTTWVHNTSVTISDVPSTEECQSHCLQSPECIAFTWHKGFCEQALWAILNNWEWNIRKLLWLRLWSKVLHMLT